jgi:hypothetical protein
MHAPATPHPFLSKKERSQAARKKRDAQIEIVTARNIQNALNAMGEIPHVGEMLFEITVTATDIKVSAGLKEQKKIITL